MTIRANDQPVDDFIVVNGNKMFVDPTDERAQALLSAGGVLHPDALRLWNAALRLTGWDWVIDLGANYGEMLVSVDLPESCRVAAIEPNPRVLPYLSRTLGIALPIAHILPVAISDTTGSQVMYEDRTWSGNSTLAKFWTADKHHVWAKILVSTKSLTTVVSDLGISASSSLLVKMDIEGYEMRVLRSCQQALRAVSRCAVMLEVVRLNASELDWLVSEFAVSYLDLQLGRLVVFDGTEGRQLSIVLNKRNVHRRDVLAFPKPA